MGKPTGFMEYDRQDPGKRPVKQRLGDYHEIEQPLNPDEITKQAARCMDCGIPSCHTFGCPVHNRIPDFNEMVYHGQWRRALEILHSTNNFPEITGRICPAPCEASCTLGINAPAVTIRHLELQIVERGWKEGWIQPEPPAEKTGKSVAIIGSGPAGLAAAQQLARLGHEVVVFEKHDRVGGILRYGIPDFKLEKHILDRRINQMKAEGVRFESNVNAGVDISAGYLQRTFDVVIITAGAWAPRDLNVSGRDLDGVHFAMDFLIQQNRRIAGDVIDPAMEITAQGKHVVVIGGGDTGSDCVGTSNRQGAKSITQIELLPQPPRERSINNPWPQWPQILRTSSSHDEGCERMWSILTKECLGDNGKVNKLRCVRLEWSPPDEDGRTTFKELPGTEFELPANLVLLAMGFLHVEHGPLVTELGLELDNRGNIKVDSTFQTTTPGVFAAGDAVRGASLVVHAINLGRQAAQTVDDYLMRS
ncbi:MAG: glutamate synthase subunit beta [Sedimentisphaerales bacterium]|nr:glutamate synthase subunit beta [Sedimentisphaerales bacterium]